MAKDPAFLFYPGDWMGGTMTMTRHLKGCYMDLLIAQFNNGPLSLETIKTVLGTDQASWTVLSKKFKQDSEGNFFNEKLATEINKRIQFSNSRRENIKKRYSKSTYVDTSEVDMYLHMENGNENNLPDVKKEKEVSGISDAKFQDMIVKEIFNVWRQVNPYYVIVIDVDYPACLEIAYRIADAKGWRKSWVLDSKENECLKSWKKIAEFIVKSPFWKTKTLDTIANQKNWQKIVNDMRQEQPAAPKVSTREYSIEEKELFELFEKWILKNAPRVAQMQEPFTIDEYFRLKEIKKFSDDKIIGLLTSMHNRADLLTKNISAYITLVKWEKGTELK